MPSAMLFRSCALADVLSCVGCHSYTLENKIRLISSYASFVVAVGLEYRQIETTPLKALTRVFLDVPLTYPNTMAWAWLTAHKV